MNDVYNADFIKKGGFYLNENIKIGLYKEDKNIFEILDFEDDNAYKNPFLFSYFSQKNRKNYSLNSLICGYSNSLKEVELITDEFGRFYISKIGWFFTEEKRSILTFKTEEFKLYKKDIAVKFYFEPIMLIKGTNIEVLKYPIPLLEQFYFDYEYKLLEVEIENISKEQIHNITKAYNLIKENIPFYYKLIEEYAPKCVIFKLETNKRNSFVTILAHGIAFYNAFQEDYDVVFFVDDIAKLTGRIILNTLFTDANNFLKVDRNTILRTIEIEEVNFVENTTLYTIFHSLYSYYTSFICLDACLENNSFKDKQRREALARILFNIKKCWKDVKLIESALSLENLSNYLSENGILIFNKIKMKCKEMENKWYCETKHFNLDNQPYNFTFSKFLEINPIF